MAGQKASTGGDVLLTGDRGYIGSVMAPYLRSRGYSVVGLGCWLFRSMPALSR